LKHKENICTAAMLFYNLPKTFLNKSNIFVRDLVHHITYITSRLHPSLNVASGSTCPPLYSSL